ncbi:type II CRISPR RNA-guided endonuclease Cas9 [Bordetella hinzii]|uniref:type II CRISPR RNA-guided endonuclease Cas9 n=1 Tax=Bordetella hinzii TaxID=103855 RepID=UPI0039FC56BF
MASPVRYRLSLDLGSTSLGWAIFRLDPGASPTAIIKAGVRIFSDGRNAKDGSSLAVTRRAARSMRRRRDRLLRRKSRMLDALLEYGFFPQDAAQRKALERLNPYALRADGLQRPLMPGEFARAIFHLNQRRGFKSNRKTDTKDSDSGALKTAISQLRQDIQASGCRTVGEWLWTHRLQKKTEGVPHQGVRARYRETPLIDSEGRNRKEKKYDLYIDRAMIEAEFDALWAVQATFNPTVFHAAAYAKLKDILLYQRPLLPVKPGRCTLLPEEERAPLALPSTQRFRIYQELNNLRLLVEQLNEQPLTLAQRDTIASLMEGRTRISFDQIRKALKLGSTARFNLEDAKRSDLKGNATSSQLSKKEFFGPAWHHFDEALQDDIVWHLLSEENESALISWLQDRTGIDSATAQAVASVSLPEGYGSLSQQALAAILPKLRSEIITYDKAVQAAGFFHHSQLGFEYDPNDVEDWTDHTTGEVKPVFKRLPYYGKALQRHVAFGSGNPEDSEEKRYGKIANPTVHIGLNQVRAVVNALIGRYGRPTEVIVELARDLKQSREQRQQDQRRQAENQKRNARIRGSIADILGIAEDRVRRDDIQKWILWEELDPKDAMHRYCPYSGVRISAAMLLSEQVEIEHILPFAMTLDDSLNNRTVSLRQANRIKRNRSPWDARKDFEAQGWHYDDILQRAGRMPLQKRYRFASDGYQRWLRDDQDFLARALNDTRYLSRVAAEYLRLVCPQGTRVIPGQLTALLRRRFGLNDILGLEGEKNRNDHRHHAVDACVIGITDHSMMQRFALASAQARDQGLTRLVEEMPLPWPTYRDHVARAVSCIWVSHKPDHGHEGAMMEETAYGLMKDGTIRQRHKADGSKGREVAKLIRIAEPRQPTRHGVDDQGRPLPYKGYIGGSNYCIEITRDTQGKWEGTVISTFDAYGIVRAHGIAGLRNTSRGQNGHPLVMRLVIGDTLRLQINDALQTMRVTKISGNGQVFMAGAHEANVDARNRDKSQAFSLVSKMAGSLRAAQARQVTISPIGEMRDPGFQG